MRKALHRSLGLPEAALLLSLSACLSLFDLCRKFPNIPSFLLRADICLLPMRDLCCRSMDDFVGTVYLSRPYWASRTYKHLSSRTHCLRQCLLPHLSWWRELRIQRGQQPKQPSRSLPRTCPNHTSAARLRRGRVWNNRLLTFQPIMRYNTRTYVLALYLHGKPKIQKKRANN